MSQMQKQSQQDSKPIYTMPQEAMKSGAIIGLFFLLQALSFIIPSQMLSTLIWLVGFVMIPIMLVFLAIRYRERYLDGYITYLQAVGYMVWTYLFALIIATLGFYFSCKTLFSDPQFLVNIQSAIEVMKETQPDKSFVEALEQTVYAMTPKSFTTSVISIALFSGMVYIYIVALFVKRTKQLL